MRRPRGYLGMVLAAACLLGACKQKQNQPGAAGGDYFRTHFQDETQFIVEEVVADLAEMAAYAKGGKAPVTGEMRVTATEAAESPIGEPSYALEVSGKGVERLSLMLKISGPVWSPEQYAGVAVALFKGVAAPAAKADPQDAGLLVRLLELRATTIEKENLELSARLQTHFTDATLHEMAALVTGAFALRDFADNFHDVRLPLCRMTAHLAAARALAGKEAPGINGQVAEAVLYTLMNNQKAALEKVAGFAEAPKLGEWARALRARNTRDYRELAKVEDRTLLENIMWFYARSRSVDADSAWEPMPVTAVRRWPDFPRMAYGAGYTVGTGHMLLQISVPMEMQEIQQIHQLSRGGELNKDNAITELNEMPGRCFSAGTNGPQVRVIGWGQWAHFLQRHLCHALAHSFDFVQRKWSVPEEAAKMDQYYEKTYGGLRLYPFVRRYNTTTKETYHRAVDEGLPVTVATPHLVSPQIWNQLCSSFGDERYIPTDNPHVNEWHKHNPPPGTAYHPKPRMYHPSLTSREDAGAELQRLHALAPYDPDIAEWMVRKNQQGPSKYEELEQAYRPMLEYAVRPNYLVAQAVTNEPARYEPLMLRYAAIKPNGYTILGNYFAGRDDEKKAAAYYEKAFELVEDPVSNAQNCEWLVWYYVRNGQEKKAEALAESAAQTYAGGGLRVKADLCAHLKKYDEAFLWYQRLEERYNQPGPLVGFCVRFKTETGDARYDGEVQKRIKTLFPRGLEKVKLADFKEAPEQGVVFTAENELMLKAGLKKGDMIVAMEGIRTYDVMQFQYLREQNPAAPMTLIVWNGTAYAEITAHPPKRRFGVGIEDYYRPKK